MRSDFSPVVSCVSAFKFEFLPARQKQQLRQWQPQLVTCERSVHTDEPESGKVPEWERESKHTVEGAKSKLHEQKIHYLSSTKPFLKYNKCDCEYVFKYIASSTRARERNGPMKQIPMLYERTSAESVVSFAYDFFFFLRSQWCGFKCGGGGNDNGDQ